MPMDDPSAQQWVDQPDRFAFDMAGGGSLPLGEFVALTPRSMATVAPLLPRRVRGSLEVYARELVNGFALPMLRCATLAEAQRIVETWWDVAVFLRIAATGLLWGEAQRSPKLLEELSEGVPSRVRGTVLDSVRERLGADAAAMLGETFETVEEMNQHLMGLASAARQGAVFDHQLLQLQKPQALVEATRIDVLLLTAILLFDAPPARRPYKVKVPAWIQELFVLLRDLTKQRAADVLRAVQSAHVEHGLVTFQPEAMTSAEDVAETLRDYTIREAHTVENLRPRGDVVTLLTSLRGAVSHAVGEGAALALSSEEEDGRTRFWVKVVVPGGVDAVRAAQSRLEQEWWLDHMLDADGSVSVMVRSA